MNAFKSPLNVPSIFLEIFVGATDITFPIVLPDPNIGLINEVSFNIELERLSIYCKNMGLKKNGNR
jgi:hypothetical protein